MFPLKLKGHIDQFSVSTQVGVFFSEKVIKIWLESHNKKHQHFPLFDTHEESTEELWKSLITKLIVNSIKNLSVPMLIKRNRTVKFSSEILSVWLLNVSFWYYWTIWLKLLRETSQRYFRHQKINPSYKQNTNTTE